MRFTMFTMRIVFIALLATPACFAFDYSDMLGVFGYTGAAGTQHGKDENDPTWYETNSFIPHLPTMSGFMGTHGTYRFFSIHEQTAILIGDGKHGLWRIQEDGHIREYLIPGKRGIDSNIDPNKDFDENSSEDQLLLKTLDDEYSAKIPYIGYAGYKYTSDKVSENGTLNYVHLSIYHPKYRGKYDDHVPIDLPQFYCTMTGAEYKHVKNVWKYAMAQPGANRLGPLAIRAGLDIKENYHNVIQWKFFPDAGVWSNVGLPNNAASNYVTTKYKDFVAKRQQTVNYQRVDFSKVDVEAYLFERYFFNIKYIFITFVMDTKARNADYTYIRPHGPYFEGLKKRNKTIKNTVVNHYPPAYVENYPVGFNTKQTAFGLPVYGHHHPRRFDHKMIGGACPNRGGDWGKYPFTNAGAGFPTNYQEITPMCDGFVIDMKLWWNLDAPTWNDPDLFLGNAGFEGQQVNHYDVDTNVYGKYNDPYLVDTGAENPNMMTLVEDGEIVESAKEKSPPGKFYLDFGRLGKYLKFNAVKFDTEEESSSSVVKKPSYFIFLSIVLFAYLFV